MALDGGRRDPADHVVGEGKADRADGVEPSSLLRGQVNIEASEVVVELGPRARADERHDHSCLLYTSDAADERSSVDLGGRRHLKKKKK